MLKIKNVILLLAVTSVFNSYAAPIETLFPLSSEINKEEFITDDSITDFKFVPNDIPLVYSGDTTATFLDAYTDLIVETTIPAALETGSNNLAITMTARTFTCQDEDGLSLPVTDTEGLVHIFLFGDTEVEMELNEPEDFSFNDEVNGLKAAKYPTRISFDTLPAIYLECTGSMDMALEITI